MSQITLFTDSRLPCPQRLLLTIHELGLQINDIREVDISKFEHKVTLPKHIVVSQIPPFADGSLATRYLKTQSFRRRTIYSRRIS